MTERKAPPLLLVLSGSDPLGYSGFQADLRHAAALGVRAVGVPTCLTEQSLDHVHGVTPIDGAHLERAIQLALEHGRVDAVKVGLLPDEASVRTIARALRDITAPIVLDPVKAASAGTELVTRGVVRALVAEFLPQVFLVTPNLPELYWLSGMEPGDDIVAAARSLPSAWVLLKGGHDTASPDFIQDILQGPNGEHSVWRHAKRSGPSPRGTGCALSTAIAAGLARGSSVKGAVGRAETLLQRAWDRAGGGRYLDLGDLS